MRDHSFRRSDGPTKHRISHSYAPCHYGQTFPGRQAQKSLPDRGLPATIRLTFDPMDALFPARLVASFLIGSIPFAVIAMWGSGIDIRKAGSGNPGFNNVLRVGARWRAVIALVGDVGKGTAALALLSQPDDRVAVAWSLGLAAVLGHCFSPFLGFNGGKGVATTVGVLLYLDLPITLAALPLYPIFRALGRRRGLSQEGAIASLITMTVITLAVLLFRGVEAGVLAAVVLAVVTLRHRTNLEAVFAGR
jgi:glycerol-3-phosphate acyltransferase PlsY